MSKFVSIATFHLGKRSYDGTPVFFFYGLGAFWSDGREKGVSQSTPQVFIGS